MGLFIRIPRACSGDCIPTLGHGPCALCVTWSIPRPEKGSESRKREKQVERRMTQMHVTLRHVVPGTTLWGCWLTYHQVWFLNFLSLSRWSLAEGHSPLHPLSGAQSQRRRPPTPPPAKVRANPSTPPPPPSTLHPAPCLNREAPSILPHPPQSGHKNFKDGFPPSLEGLGRTRSGCTRRSLSLLRRTSWGETGLRVPSMTGTPDCPRLVLSSGHRPHNRLLGNPSLEWLLVPPRP